MSKLHYTVHNNYLCDRINNIISKHHHDNNHYTYGVYMTKKEKCKELMAKFFGPASAATVDNLSEDECVQKCRAKVFAFLGEEQAKEFDKIWG